MRRLVIAAVAAIGVIAAVAATRRRVPQPGDMPPPPAGVREPRTPAPFAPAGTAFVDD